MKREPRTANLTIRQKVFLSPSYTWEKQDSLKWSDFPKITQLWSSKAGARTIWYSGVWFFQCLLSTRPGPMAEHNGQAWSRTPTPTLWGREAVALRIRPRSRKPCAVLYIWRWCSSPITNCTGWNGGYGDRYNDGFNLSHPYCLHQSSLYPKGALARWQARFGDLPGSARHPESQSEMCSKGKLYPALLCQESQHYHSTLNFPTPKVFTEDNYIQSPLLALGSFDQSQTSWSDLSLGLLLQPHDSLLCLPSHPTSNLVSLPSSKKSSMLCKMQTVVDHNIN